MSHLQRRVYFALQLISLSTIRVSLVSRHRICPPRRSTACYLRLLPLLAPSSARPSSPLPPPPPGSNSRRRPYATRQRRTPRSRQAGLLHFHSSREYAPPPSRYRPSFTARHRPRTRTCCARRGPHSLSDRRPLIDDRFIWTLATPNMVHTSTLPVQSSILVTSYIHIHSDLNALFALP